MRSLTLSAAVCAAMATLTYSENLSAQTSERTNQPSFPNAIHLTADDIPEIFQNDPFGLERLLGFQPGISFHSTGDYGAEDWIMVRGFGRDDSRIILVLVDGRPINQRTHTVDFGDVILGSIESLTIYPGPVPARFGGYHAVIDITTRRNTDHAHASATIGAQSTYGMTAGIGRTRDSWYWGAEFELRTTDAQSNETFSYQLRAVPPGPPSGAGCARLPFPPVCAPTPIDTITFSERPERVFLAQTHVGFLLGNQAEVTLRANHLHTRKSLGSERWIPTTYAPASLSPENQRPQVDARNRDYTSVSASLQPTANATADYLLSAWFIFEEEELGTFGKQYYLGRQERSRYGTRGHYRVALGDTLGLTAGGELNRVSGKVLNANEVSFPWAFYDLVDSQTFYGAFLDLDAQPWWGAELTAGLRLDGQQDARSRNEVMPIISLQQSLLNDTAQAYAVYGESRRWIPPSELEKFATGGFRVPMESVRGIEFGARAATADDRLRGRVAWFELKNEFPAGAVNVEPRIDIGRTSGIELGLDYQPEDRLRMMLNVTRFASPRGTGERNQSPGDYTWLANLGVFFEATPQLGLEAVVRYMDRFRTEFDDLTAAEAQLRALEGPPFFITLPETFEGYGRFRQTATTIIDVNANYRWDPSGTTMLSLGVYNLTNQRYNTFPELPQWELPNQMPGRQVHATLSMKF